MEIQFWQLVQRGILRLQNQDVFEWRHCDVIELIPPLCLLIDQIFIYEDYLQEVSWFLHKMRWWVFAKVPHHQSTYISFFHFQNHWCVHLLHIFCLMNVSDKEIAKANSEPCQTSKVKHFEKTF